MITAVGQQASFTINNVPYPRGRYRIIEHGEYIGLQEIGELNVNIVAPTPPNEWYDNNGDPLGSKADLITYLKTVLFVKRNP